MRIVVGSCKVRLCLLAPLGLVSTNGDDADDEFEVLLDKWQREQEEEEAITAGIEETQSRRRLSSTCRDLMRPESYPLQTAIVELAAFLSKPPEAGEAGEGIYSKLARQLRHDVLHNIREFASDCVQPRPTAILVKALAFDRDDEGERGIFNDGYPSVYVHGPLTKRVYKCRRATCWMCLYSMSCGNATWRSRPVDFRRYLLTDFMEPDRYMKDYRTLLTSVKEFL